MSFFESTKKKTLNDNTKGTTLGEFMNGMCQRCHTSNMSLVESDGKFLCDNCNKKESK